MASRKPKSGGSPDPLECAYELKLQSVPRHISKVEKFLHTANEKLHLDDGTMYRLLVALTEAVNNAILHGNSSDPGKQVRICLNATRSKVVLRVEDEGRGFDPDVLPNPLDQENLLKDHGRGVFLIRSVVDSVHFERFEGGSAVIMTVNLELLR